LLTDWVGDIYIFTLSLNIYWKIHKEKAVDAKQHSDVGHLSGEKELKSEEIYSSNKEDKWTKCKLFYLL